MMVMGVTFDGLSINRRLLKIHDQSPKCINKRKGKDISWDHLKRLYESDKGKASGLSMAHKLKHEHIYLNSFSKMHVDLISRVLSNSVSMALMLVLEDEASETSLFASMFNRFFDMLNVSNYTNGTRYRNPTIYPYRHGNDHRLKWLEQDFIQFLDEWEDSVENKEGFSKAEKNLILLSHETRVRLRITDLIVFKI
uniref:Transposable element P transposase-like GTP-binding insertion domain-containing protein n=1 Tax=Amphimedon queenslandica TaxID=400682 RepID=A0A1X7UNS3_AMPQE